MESQLHIFSSNRVELLYEKLKQNLFSKGSFAFARRQIVVPNASMRSWLLLRLAKDPDCNIAAGIDVCYLDQALRHFCRKTGGSESIFIPSEMELAFLIEAQLRQVFKEYSHFDTDQKQIWESAMHYLKSQKRLTSLSNQLAQLFIQYGRYGCRMLNHWEQSKSPTHWQASLWQKLKIKYPTLAFLYQQLPDILNSESPLPAEQLHLFSLSFIPAQAHLFLAKASRYLQIHYYLLSPCKVFWSDICSDRERAKLLHYWQQKGASESQQLALDDYLREHNGLLANFGRMGREMAQQIEQQDIAYIEDRYELPQIVRHLAEYAGQLPGDVSFNTSCESLSLLHALQADMAILRHPNNSAKIEMDANDHSIQLHFSYTKHREVENLYNTLLHLLTRHSNDPTPMMPSDIIIMLPDLPSYESTICSIFGAEKSLLDFQIQETPSLAKSTLVQGFFQLINLAMSRWEADQVLQLLDYSEFHRKQGFTSIDVQQIRSWVELSGAYWGQNASHQHALLTRDHGKDCQLVDQHPAGTWEHSMKRLLMSLAIESAGLDDSQHPFNLPIEEMEASQTELLEKWFLLLEALKEDLKPLSSEACMGLKSWASYLEFLKEKYFYEDWSSKESMIFSKALSKQIQGLASFINLQLEVFPYASVHYQLVKLIDAELSTYREDNLQTVRFCSLAPMRTLPAKVVVLLGMGEGSFPRKENPISLNALSTGTDCDYAPSQTDFDRYLFLEALLSARSYFVLSYVGYSFDEQRELLPSLLIQELFSYLDEGYQVGNQPPSQHCFYKHPFDPFDKAYFSLNARFPSYNSEHYQLAQAYYKTKKNLPYQFVNFSRAIPPSYPQEILVTIHELAGFASNPLKAYCNKTLKIYLEKKRKALCSEEPFVLSALEKYQLRMQAIKSPLESVLRKANHKGLLPRGLFKCISSKELSSEIESMYQNFETNQVKINEIVPIRFLDHCEKPICDSNGLWTLPPITLKTEYGQIKIVGSLKEVSPQGLIFHQRRDLVGAIKLWPQFLLLLTAIERYQLPILTQMLSSKQAKPIVFSDAKEAAAQLETYLAYYLMCIEVPSPLIPEWIPEILKEDHKHFEKAMRSSLEGTFSSFYNDYALWIFRDLQNLPSAEELHREWRPLSLSLFSSLAQAL